MVIGHEFVGVVDAVGPGVTDVQGRRARQSAEGHIVCGRCRNCLRRPPAPVPEHDRHRRRTAPGASPNHRDALPQRVAPRPRDPDATSPRSSTRSATPRIARWSSIVVGEDVLITGAGPIGSSPRHRKPHRRAQHRRHRRQRLPPRARRTLGATRVVDVRPPSRRDVMDDLHMAEGFDVGLEMSGNPPRFNDMLEPCATAARSRCSASARRNARATGTRVIFKGLTLHGIYGRECTRPGTR